VNVLVPQILNQGHARSLVLDHKFISVAGFAPAAMQLDDLAPQIGIFKPFTKNVQHPDGLSPDLEHHAGRIAGKLLAAHGGLPTYHDPVLWCPPGRLIVKLNPVPFDEAAALRDRLLLVLRCEVQRSHGPLELVQDLARLALGVQELAEPTQMIAPWAERDAEVGLSDRWQIEVRPALLFEQMTDKIVQVQALHNHDDGVLGLVIETAEQRVG